jgi:hypothetical protein
MLLAITALALQLQTVAFGAGRPPRPSDPADSARDIDRARSAQADFERARRGRLPWETGGAGRCDVRIVRYCWWYEDGSPITLPAEPTSIADRRAELLNILDSVAQRRPGDDWVAALRVHYLLEAHREAAAGAAARECRGTPWWCDALLGYASHGKGEDAAADSAFTRAMQQMPEDARCRWSDIRTLLPGDARGRYERLPCDQRAVVERRYWLLARPRLAAPANEWQVEFSVRRVQSWIAQRAASPQALRWGDDAEELLLRYGWPTSWGRVQRSAVAISEPGIVGHDPSPSFAFGPRESLLDTLAGSGDDGWELASHHGESRVALRSLYRIGAMSAQLARFRRGDSTLVVASYAVWDDSVTAPDVRLAAALDDGTSVAAPPDSSRRGASMLRVAGAPRVAGVEVSDSAAGTFGRSRVLYAPSVARRHLALSDLLLFEGGAEPASTLDSALVRAFPSDSVVRSRPLGLFWETYGLAEGGESVDVAVSVERIDNGFFRAARQRLGLEDKDTPLRMRWTDARPPASGVTGRSVSLDLANLPGGRYRVTLSVTPTEGGPVATSREIELIER